MRVEKVLGVVLAGGSSRRMGFDKRVLEVQGSPLVLRAARMIGQVFAEVVVSTQPDSGWSSPSIPALPDLRVHSGPLAGLEAALTREEESGRSVFLFACDLPYVGPDLVRHILRISDRARDASAVVPAVADRVQPLCGLYRSAALAAVRDHLDRGRRAVRDLLSQLEVHRVDLGPELPFFRPDLFHNLNAPADLEQLQEGRPH